MKIKGIANSLRTSRDGTTVGAAAARKAVGQRVPLLAYHNWDSDPVGYADFTEVDTEGLHYTGELFETGDHAPQLKQAITSGVMRVSVGFLELDRDSRTHMVTALDMLELSLTPTPADPLATCIPA